VRETKNVSKVIDRDCPAGYRPARGGCTKESPAKDGPARDGPGGIVLLRMVRLK
jgi:hypothetical protein